MEDHDGSGHVVGGVARENATAGREVGVIRAMVDVEEEEKYAFGSVGRVLAGMPQRWAPSCSHAVSIWRSTPTVSLLPRSASSGMTISRLIG